MLHGKIWARQGLAKTVQTKCLSDCDHLLGGPSLTDMYIYIYIIFDVEEPPQA